MLQVQWNGKLGFVTTPGSGVRFVLDAHPEVGGEGSGPTPVEALLASLAACTGMDVVSILRKKRQELESYTIEVEGDRSPDGEYPRPFTAIRLRHVLKGQDLDPAAVARAIELSEQKYCTVMATLKFSPKISSGWTIEGVGSDNLGLPDPAQ